MNFYIKTSYMYLLPCISYPIVVAMELLAKMDERYIRELLLFGIVYILLFISCFLETRKNRKLMQEVIANGRCYAGTVEGLQEVSREVMYINRGHMLETTAYRILVKVQDELGNTKEFCSDAISKWKKNKIARSVKVYEYFGDIVVLYEKSKVRTRYEVKKSNEVIRVDGTRAVLGFLNSFLIIPPIAIMVIFITQ